MVTGAAGAVGSSIVGKLGNEGWKVAGIDLEEAKADLFFHVDVTDRTAMKEAAARTADILGPIGLLVTAAGDYEKFSFGEMPLARWKRMLDVWLGGTANACAAVVPQMMETGCGAAVLLSAELSSKVLQNSYAAAAAGTVTAFAKSFGCEVAPEGVCVNCLSLQPSINPERVAHTVNFLATEGHYYAGQVISI